MKLYESTITLSNHDRYQFVGWSTSPERTRVDYLPGETIRIFDNKATLYDVWEKMICLTISPNPTSDQIENNLYYYFSSTTGGSIRISDVYKIFNTTTATTKTINNQNLTRENYEFEGWGESAEATVALSGNIDITSDKTIYALWSKRIDNIEWKQDIIPVKSSTWYSTEYQYSMTFSKFTYSSTYSVGFNPYRSETITTSQKGITGGIVANAFAMGDNGHDVIIIGNPSNAGRSAVWTSIADDIKEIQFNYDLDFGDNIDMAGVIFGVTETTDSSGNPTQLKGYYLRLNQSGSIDLCEITYNVRKTNYDTSRMSSITSKKSFKNNLAKKGKITIKISNNSFIINIVDQNSVTDTYTQTSAIPRKSFGFITNHYRHGCSYVGMFKITDVKVFVEE